MARLHSRSVVAVMICSALAVTMIGLAGSPAIGDTPSWTDGRRDPTPPKPKRGPGLARVMQAGPSSPISPDIDSYYNALRRGECANVREQTVGNDSEVTRLYSALADLCLGYLHAAYQVDWAAAETAYTNSAALTDCLSLEARDAVGRALARHQATGRPRPSFGSAPLGTACSPQPTYVGVIAKDNGGKPSLIVLGVRMFEVTDVKVNGVWHPATSRNAIDGTECARADVLGVDVAPGDDILVRVRGNGYRTPALPWTIGPALSEDAIVNLDTDSCLPPPPGAT